MADVMASDPATTDVHLETVVITGTRTEKPILDTPVRTEVITRENIEEQHARDVKEALELVPGLLLKPIHGKSGYEVWMQGFDSNRVKVLIDGEPVAASTGSTVDVTQINSLEIERIEIVKGATSALYGSSAMGGVINIITRQTTPGLHYEFKLEGASFGDDNFGGDSAKITSQLGSALVTYGSEAFYGSLGITRKDSDGFEATPETWASQSPEGPRTTGDIKIGWTPVQGQRYEIYGNSYDESLRTRTSTNAGGKIIEKHKDEDSERFRIGARGFWETSESEYQARLFHESFENTTYQDVIVTPEKENHRYAEHGKTKASFDWNWAATENHLLGMGTEFFEEDLEQRKDNIYEVPRGTDRNSIEIYLQDDIFIADNLEVVPGIRTQRDSDFGYYSAPKVNLRYDFSTWGDWESFLRGGIGLGYRVPNLKERYYVFDHSHLGYMVIGNPDLTPEKSRSYQAGFGLVKRSDQGTETNLDANLFYNDIEDLIETAFDEQKTLERNDNVSIYSYVNVASAKTWGAEFVITHNFNEKWQLSAGYTWTRGRDDDSGKDLPNRPEHQLKSNIRYRAGAIASNISVILNHVYQSSEFIDLDNRRQSEGYHMLDLKLNIPLSDRFSFYTGIDNLTDSQRDFADPNDQGPITGRYFYLGLSVKG